MEALRLKEKLNYLWFGLISGVILPFIIYLIFIHPKYKGFNFDGVDYKQMMLVLFPVLLSRCIFPNVLIFFIFLWKDMNFAAKGVLYSSMIFTGLLLILKFVN